MRIWGKIIENTHLINDTVIEDFSDDTRTHKIFNSLDKICYEFNISRPIWLEKNIKEFKRFSHTQFSKDNFVDEIEFDYLELRIIEED